MAGSSTAGASATAVGIVLLASCAAGAPRHPEQPVEEQRATASERLIGSWTAFAIGSKRGAAREPLDEGVVIDLRFSRGGGYSSRVKKDGAEYTGAGRWSVSGRRLTVSARGSTETYPFELDEGVLVLTQRRGVLYLKRALPRAFRE
jgi:hypothetical protein